MQIINVSNWELIEIPVSGANQKYWLSNGKQRGLFKFQREQYDDYWVESLASEIIELCGLVSMDVNIAEYGSVKGSFCYDNCDRINLQTLESIMNKYTFHVNNDLLAFISHVILHRLESIKEMK